MKIFRGLRHPGIAPACALTVGNFDGVHLGHQAMLALLRAAAEKHGVPSCVLTFEPHPRDWFASAYNQPDRAPARISTLRDKLTALAACGVEQVVILPFNERQAGQSAQAFIDDVLVRALGVRHVLIGDDFRFGARRAGDAAMLEAAGRERGFEVARMDSHELRGLRVSSTAVREALAAGDMQRAAALLGRPYSISGHVVHGRCLGRALSESAPGRGDGFRTLNLRFSRRTAAWRPAASGIFVARIHGLWSTPLDGVANLGTRPSLDTHDINGGRVLLEVHALRWPVALGAEGGYAKIIRVDLLHKLHDELRYHSLAALAAGISRDCAAARDWHARHAAP